MKRLVTLIGLGSLIGRSLWGWLRSHRNGLAETERGPRRFKRRLISAVVVLLAIGIGGLLVVLSGLVPIAASAGHWAPTAWFLQLAKRRSVATHTLTVETPRLDEPWLVLKGAGHYESGCRPCHGAPDLPHPRVAWAMTPPPPYLPPRIGSWAPDELFYIVKHGIKFTGMPAWPTQRRDDEVRALVAFLRSFSELDAGGYRELVFGGAGGRGALAPLPALSDTGAARPASCARCHGPDGNGRGSAAFPKLAGQREHYLTDALIAYARGERASGIMQPIAAAIDPEQMRALARHFGGLSGTAGPAPSGGATTEIARGREIAAGGIPARRVPSCADCHGPDPASARRNPRYPRLAGQFADYLALQLELFRSGDRGGTRYAAIMRRVVAGLRPEEMRAVALYYSSLSPSVADGTP